MSSLRWGPVGMQSDIEAAIPKHSGLRHLLRPRAMAQHKASGEVMVLDIVGGVCSDPLHYDERDAPLDEYHLDQELVAYDPAEWLFLIIEKEV